MMAALGVCSSEADVERFFSRVKMTVAPKRKSMNHESRTSAPFLAQVWTSSHTTDGALVTQELFFLAFLHAAQQTKNAKISKRVCSSLSPNNRYCYLGMVHGKDAQDQFQGRRKN